MAVKGKPLPREPKVMWVYASTQEHLRQIIEQGVGVNGTSQEKLCTLVQTEPFLLGNVESAYQYWQVHAAMRTDELYVDMDDYDSQFNKLDGVEMYLTTPISELSWVDMSGVGYGLLCYGIPIDRVTSIELVLVDALGILSTTRVFVQQVLVEDVMNAKETE